MLYQLPLHLSVVMIFVDLGLIAWIFVTNKWNKRRTFSRIGDLILFFGFSLLKLISTTPSFASSSPNDLIFRSSDEIGKLFLARQSDQGLFIFWKERINGMEGRLTLEMEGIYPNGLIIFKENEGSQLELRPKLEIEGVNWKPIVIKLKDSEFRPISEKGAKAWKNYKNTTGANYASHLFSLAFLTVFFVTIFKKPSKNL